MRISIRGLDTGFAYPCTKREVMDAFGKDLLSSATFELRYQFSEARQGKRRPFRGTVLASVYVSRGYVDPEDGPVAWINLYRIREAEFSPHVGHQLVRAMKATMVPWIETKLKAIESSPYRSLELVANLGEHGLELFELRSLPKTLEVSKIEF